MLIDIGQLYFIDEKLRTILTEMEKELGIHFVATSLLRIDDPGVHGQLPLRGVDLRCRHKPFGDFIARFINRRWQYDWTRPEKVVCMCHETDGKGLHLHFQSHPNTRWRMEE